MTSRRTSRQGSVPTETLSAHDQAYLGGGWQPTDLLDLPPYPPCRCTCTAQYICGACQAWRGPVRPGRPAGVQSLVLRRGRTLAEYVEEVHALQAARADPSRSGDERRAIQARLKYVRGLIRGNGERPDRVPGTLPPPPDLATCTVLAYYRWVMDTAWDARRPWTRESLLTLGRLWWRVNGRLPASADLHSTQGMPSSTTLCRVFHTLSGYHAALRKAAQEDTIDGVDGSGVPGLAGHEAHANACGRL